MNNRRLRILSFIVITYMLIALLWWAILLHRKNKEVFILKSQLMEEQFMTNAGVATVDVTTLSEFTEVKSDYERQMYMIFGEAIVFGITLILGIYFINRAYVRELSASEKQKNFLLSITHELKSPLASINLILGTFIKRDLPQDKVKELSEDGLRESTRLEELFNKILISTRLGQGYPFNFESANLSLLVDECTYLFSKSHPEVELNHKIQPDIVKNVDQESMISVVKNLLENAYKYSKEPKKIDLEIYENDGNTILSVSDNGRGIPKEERAKVFDQFYRVGSENVRDTKGTGLGLYIVHEIVTAHKGKIKINDNPNGGTKFTITM